VSDTYHTFDELHQLGQDIANRAAHAALLERPNQHGGPPNLGEQARAYFDRMDLPATFTAFATPDPDSIQPAVDSLWTVAHALDPNILGSQLRADPNSPARLLDPIPTGAWKPAISVASRIATIRISRMKNWEGDSAE
jgi:hypothetical protein